MATLSFWLLLASFLTYQASADTSQEGSNIFVAFDDAAEDRRRVVRSAELNSDSDLETGAEKRIVKRQYNGYRSPGIDKDMTYSSRLYPEPYTGKGGTNGYVSSGKPGFIYFPPLERQVEPPTLGNKGWYYYFNPPPTSPVASVGGKPGFIYFPPLERQVEPPTLGYEKLRGPGAIGSSDPYLWLPALPPNSLKSPITNVGGNKGWYYYFNPPPTSPVASMGGKPGFIYFPPLERQVEPPTLGYESLLGTGTFFGKRNIQRAESSSEDESDSGSSSDESKQGSSLESESDQSLSLEGGNQDSNFYPPPRRNYVFPQYVRGRRSASAEAPAASEVNSVGDSSAADSKLMLLDTAGPAK